MLAGRVDLAYHPGSKVEPERMTYELCNSVDFLMGGGDWRRGEGRRVSKAYELDNDLCLNHLKFHC